MSGREHDEAEWRSVSYTKFFYSTPRSDPNDTGAKGHRFSSLIGPFDSNGAEDTGRLNVTFHHDWWGPYVVERMPRVRFGKVHLFNNVWTSTGNDYSIGIGVGANVLTENNVFAGVKTPIDLTSFIDANIAPSSAKSAGNDYVGTSGDTPADLAPGAVFTPPYAYAANPTAAVRTLRRRASSTAAAAA